MDESRIILVNHALVCPDESFTEYLGLRTANFVNPQYEASPFGEVFLPPSALYFARGNLKDRGRSAIEADRLSTEVRRSALFDSKIEIEKGDKVMFTPMMYVDNEDDKIGEYLLVPYDQMFAVIRDDEVIMLNGYLFVEPLSYKEEEAIFEGLQTLKAGSVKPGVGKIMYIGSNASYLYTDNLDNLQVDVNRNQTVLFDPNAGVRVEWPGFQKLNQGGHELIRIQRKDIYGIIEP